MSAMTQVPVEQAIRVAGEHHRAGRLVEAEAIYRRILAVQPENAEALSLLGVIAGQVGQFDKAIELQQKAIALSPDNAGYHYHLGNHLRALGHLDRAIACYQRALAVNPRLVEAHANLGVAWHDKGQFDTAIACYESALAINPTLPEAHNNLGNALKGKGQLDAAIACCQRAIQLNPTLVEAHANLGKRWIDMGRLDPAIACFRRALAINPGFVPAHDDLLLALHFDTDSDPRRLFVESRLWNDQHARPLKLCVASCANSRDPDRPLRIGYVSADFVQHPCALFMFPLFRHHDRRQFDLFCYAQVAQDDDYTREFRQLIPQWRSTFGRSDADVAAMIRQDGIDILVDLKLHTADNRLLVFAYKPAPIQVTWLGYPGTTGMDAINYRLTDPYLDPPGLDDEFYSERSIRLPDTFWCYDPHSDEPPARQSPGAGTVTFGCLNNFCKVNDAVLALWASVLSANPTARMILLVPEGMARQSVVDRLGRCDIRADRIEFVPRQNRSAYLRTYDRIDIVLDTFPYNGHTTNFDALWMGVPVVTLAGRTAVGRAGISQLTNLGLPELIARAPEHYVQIATELAADRPRLAELRSTLRQRMRASPLMDAARFARSVENAYRSMWHTWCQQSSENSPSPP